MSSVPVRFFTDKMSDSKKLTGLEKRRFLQEGALDRNIFARLTLLKFKRESAAPIEPEAALSLSGIMQSYGKEGSNTLSTGVKRNVECVVRRGRTW